MSKEVDLTKAEALNIIRLKLALENAERAYSEFVSSIAKKYKIDISKYRLSPFEGKLTPEETNG